MTAELRCTECGETFTTPTDDDGGLQFDGVREHGNEHDGRWDYEVVSR